MFLQQASYTPSFGGLGLNRTGQRMLSREFIEETLIRHYGALLDPYLSELYVWQSIYPSGVSFHINGRPLDRRPVMAPEAVRARQESDIRTGRRGKVTRAVFILAKEPLPEERQGVVIATYGTTIRLDPLLAHPRQPELITGWVEAPELVECLSPNPPKDGV